tara:strand:+ start:319 stop:609 length:291 start_codon:yes stop_codon:yes gene_type:complete
MEVNLSTSAYVWATIMIVGILFTIYQLFKAEPDPYEEPKRTRNKKGKYVGDDKSTPDINEAWEGGKPGRPLLVKKPKRGRGRPKGSKNKPKAKKNV